MTDDVTITLFLAILAIIVISWAWYLYSVRREEILKKVFAERKTDFFDVPIEKRKPRTQIKKPVAKKAAVKKPVTKKTTTKGIK